MNLIACDILGLSHTVEKQRLLRNNQIDVEDRVVADAGELLTMFYPDIVRFVNVRHGYNGGNDELLIVFNSPAAAVEFKLRHSEYVREIR